MFGGGLQPEADSRPGLGDWLARGAVALPFLIFGLEKFSTRAGPHWVEMFARIGWGDWFRYFAGSVEVLGAVLVMVPRLALWGFALLACTMLAAALIVAFVLRTPGQSVFPGIFLVAVIAVGLWRWRGMGG